MKVWFSINDQDEESIEVLESIDVSDFKKELKNRFPDDFRNIGITQLQIFGSNRKEVATRSLIKDIICNNGIVHVVVKCNFPDPVQLNHIDKICNMSQQPHKSLQEMVLANATLEQQNFVAACESGVNVAMPATPGSGKTSSILLMGKVLNTKQSKHILVVTYNSKLRHETRDRARQAGLLRQLEIHTYHSFGWRYYNHDCSTDKGIDSVIKNKTPPMRSIPLFDIIVLDECQDLTNILFTFFLRILSDIPYTTPPQLVLMGDPRQSIYRFRGSDERYLTLIEQILHETSLRPEWSRLSLSTSFRVSGNMAAFVNRAMVKEQLIHATKPAGQPVQYLVGGAFKAVEWIARRIVALRNSAGILVDEMVVLAPSVNAISNQKSPLAMLVNLLTREGVMIHLPSADQENKAANTIAERKLSFMTFHQSKGIERKVVIVFNFDKSYFDFFNKTAPRHKCSNELYVACTRAKELLILLAEEYEGDHLPFLDRPKINEMWKEGAVEVINVHLDRAFGKRYTPVAEKIEQIGSVAVKDLIRWLPERVKEWCVSELVLLKIVDASQAISLPVSVTFDSHTEKVAELNGLAIPAMLERESSTVSMLSHLKKHVTARHSDEVNKTLHKYFTAFSERVPEPTTAAHFLELSCLYNAMVSGYNHKLAQIKHYDWLQSEEVDQCVTFLKSVVVQPSTALFEQSVEHTYRGSKTIRICGSVDVMTESTLFEIKCVTALLPVHFIQLALYAWVWQCSNLQSNREFQLVNVTTGEVWQLGCDGDALRRVADKVIEHFLVPQQDEKLEHEFVASARRDIRAHSNLLPPDDNDIGVNDIVDMSVVLEEGETEVVAVNNITREDCALTEPEAVRSDTSLPTMSLLLPVTPSCLVQDFSQSVVVRSPGGSSSKRLSRDICSSNCVEQEEDELQGRKLFRTQS